MLPDFGRPGPPYRDRSMSSDLHTQAAVVAGEFEDEQAPDAIWLENLVAASGTVVAVLLASCIAVVMYLA